MSVKMRKSSIVRGGSIIIILLLFYSSATNQLSDQDMESSLPGEEVEIWAKRFGEELWDLGQRMTKSQEIKEKYKVNNARVESKNGTELLASIADNVGRMLASKMEAVKCILSLAEERADEFDEDNYVKEYTYYSSKYSTIQISGNENVTEHEYEGVVEADSEYYGEMHFDYDSHFFNLSVNTSHSSVHVPTNVYDRSKNATIAIQWSEELDEVFLSNYKADPALSWQYFCSETGVFRHYPAMRWPLPDGGEKVDIFDCRRRSWYIESATCSKDVIILIDNSGSMAKFRSYLAKLTVRKIMETFSNNDFLNIFYYSNEVNDTVKCFSDKLVQATPENIKVFREKLVELKTEGHANVTKAFIKAFELLEHYRTIRQCNESVQGCNQAIMLVTDGVASNLTDVFERYNWIESENGTKVPVRVFTYLLGQEVTKVEEIIAMACTNRGYYSHIKSMDEVSEDVLKYVNVIAQPLVIQGNEHPPTWTHAFVDYTHENRGTSDADDNILDDEVRLMIAVGVPAFDRKENKKNTTKNALLLGVAGTDVPIEEIYKLTLPYKLGVNGYSFIVSNNGYVLLHPDLRPAEMVVEDGKNIRHLKENYNSIDFAEVEQVDGEYGPRDPPQILMDLRRRVIDAKSVDSWSNIPVKFHYDQRRRVSQEKQDYYFTSLPNTPFSLGLVLPSSYGKTWIKVGDQVKYNKHLGVDFKNFFVGENWKIHPDWVYCKYHYFEGHEFLTPEIELLHFLEKLNHENFKWSEQYEDVRDEDKDGDGKSDGFCSRRTLDTDAYYCNNELVQLLIFDAKVTNASYSADKWSETDAQSKLIKSYDATLRFVATMSGLTRWQFIYGEVENNTAKEFGDSYTKAVDETWYKSAVLQNLIDPESFIYSVTHANDDSEPGETKVTAALTISPRDGGKVAPACVVGFQFSQRAMLERFMTITNQTKEPDLLTCSSEEFDCYVIDNNGYVILSENLNHTGKFFGEIEGSVMHEMVLSGVFKNITVYDLQGLTWDIVPENSAADWMRTPLNLLSAGLKWLATELVFFLGRINYWVGADELIYDDDETLDYEEARAKKAETQTKRLRKGQNEEEEAYFNRPKIVKNETIYKACDKKSTLFVLDQNKFLKRSDAQKDVERNCSRPYHVKRIPHSNLVLIVINGLYNEECEKKFSAQPEIISYTVDFPCYKVNNSDFYRRRLEECFTEHPLESEYHKCGRGTTVQLNFYAFFVSSIVFAILKLLK